jgi:hypothetical protein
LVHQAQNLAHFGQNIAHFGKNWGILANPLFFELQTSFSYQIILIAIEKQQQA